MEKKRTDIYIPFYGIVEYQIVSDEYKNAVRQAFKKFKNTGPVGMEYLEKYLFAERLQQVFSQKKEETKDAVECIRLTAAQMVALEVIFNV